MSPLNWTIALLLAAVLAAGCDDSPPVTETGQLPAVDSAELESDIEQAGNEAEQASEEAGRTFSETAEETGEKLNEGRTKFAAELEQRMEGLDEEIAGMKIRAEKLSAEGKAELKDSWDRLEARREIVARQLKAVRESTSDEWSEVKEKTSAAWNEFEEAVRKTADKLTD